MLSKSMRTSGGGFSFLLRPFVLSLFASVSCRLVFLRRSCRRFRRRSAEQGARQIFAEHHHIHGAGDRMPNARHVDPAAAQADIGAGQKVEIFAALVEVGRSIAQPIRHLCALRRRQANRQTPRADGFAAACCTPASGYRATSCGLQVISRDCRIDRYPRDTGAFFRDRRTRDSGVYRSKRSSCCPATRQASKRKTADCRGRSWSPFPSPF